MFKFGIKSTFKSLVNVKEWVGWNGVSQNGRFVYRLYRDFFGQGNVQKVSESFDEAVARLGFTEDFLASQEQKFYFAANFYLSVLLVSLLYTVWIAIKKDLFSFIVMVPLNFMMFSFYFRESFWLMQIRKKRLGMTFSDWVKQVVFKNA